MFTNRTTSPAEVTELTIDQLDDVHGGASALAILAYGVVVMGLTAEAVGLTAAIAATKVVNAL